MSANKKETQSFWTTVPGILTGCATLLGAVGGLIAALHAAGLIGSETPTPPPAITPIVVTRIVDPDPISTEFVLPSPFPATATPELAALPQGSGCPYDPRAGWLPYRDTWYGAWNGYSIRYDIFNFYVWDPNQWNAWLGTYGLEIPYSGQIGRDAWVELVNSPFWVCVDVPGNVYVIYVP